MGRGSITLYIMIIAGMGLYCRAGGIEIYGLK